MGKPPSDLLDFHITWLGSYDECVAIAASVNKSGDIISPFNGRYCLGSFPLGPGGQVCEFDYPAKVKRTFSGANPRLWEKTTRN